MKKFKKIYIEITNKCNLNCKFCSIDNKEKREMNLEEFEYILKSIDNYTDYLCLHVKGEPLLHSNFLEILNLCKKYNKKVNLTTNGSLLKYKTNDILNTNVVRQINISMQSLINLNYLEDILESVNQLNLNSPIQIVFRFWALKDNNFSNIEQKIINSIINYFNLDQCTNNKILEENNTKLKERLYINKAPEFIWPSLDNNYYSILGHCHGLKTHIAILANGDVVPCCLDSNGIINLGNIFKTSFSDILKSKRTINIINNFKENKACEELCKKCSFKNKQKNSELN